MWKKASVTFSIPSPENVAAHPNGIVAQKEIFETPPYEAT
jgi:hypothetical protein